MTTPGSIGENPPVLPEQRNIAPNNRSTIAKLFWNPVTKTLLAGGLLLTAVAGGAAAANNMGIFKNEFGAAVSGHASSFANTARGYIPGMNQPATIANRPPVNPIPQIPEGGGGHGRGALQNRESPV